MISKLLLPQREGKHAYLLYFAIKILTISVLYILMEEVFVRDFFYYPDLSYNPPGPGHDPNLSYMACNFNTPNFLYTMAACKLSFNELSSWVPIFLAVLINTLRDLVIINIGIDSLKKKNFKLLYLLVALLTLNPYLSYNHLRLTTDTFASLGLLHIFVSALYKQKIDLSFLIIAMALIGFRNPLAMPYAIYIIFERLDNRGNSLRNISNIMLIGFLSCLIVLILSFGARGYFDLVLPGLGYGPYSFNEIMALFQGMPNLLKVVLTICIIIPLHLFLLLAAREHIVGYGFITIFESGFYSAVLSFGFIFIMFTINSISVYGTVKYFLKNNWVLLSIFSYVIPSFLIVAHIRYLYPLMALTALGFVLWAENWLSEKKRIGMTLDE